MGAVGKTIPTIQLDNDLSATVLRYLRLQEQKQLVETRVKTLDAEMQRLKGRIVAKPNISCMAMGGVRHDVGIAAVQHQGKRGR